MIFVFPEDEVRRGSADSAFDDQVECLSRRGHSIAIATARNRIKILTGKHHGGDAVFRGWMMDPDRYSQMYASFLGQGITLVTSPVQYRSAHHIDGWYHAISDLTPRTILFPGASRISGMAIPEWRGYFVKDYVKSLTTRRGSRAESPAEIDGILNDIENYRGLIEGGVCLRKLEDWNASTEARHFVYRGIPHSAVSPVPDIVKLVAQRLFLPFYCVDSIINSQGDARVVEIGDGQVSDLKHWTPDQFAEIFSPNAPQT